MFSKAPHDLTSDEKASWNSARKHYLAGTRKFPEARAGRFGTKPKKKMDEWIGWLQYPGEVFPELDRAAKKERAVVRG
jgi:hypothetical protein